MEKHQRPGWGSMGCSRPTGPGAASSTASLASSKLAACLCTFGVHARARPPPPRCHGQVSSITFSLDANLALLRFYQFSPASAKTGVIVKVLLKAVMQLPSPDFKACVHLIPERLQVGRAGSGLGCGSVVKGGGGGGAASGGDTREGRRGTRRGTF